MPTGNEIWSRRLKELRQQMELSQKELGIQAGLDPFVASARINRYELGIHKADNQIAERLAEVLDVPTAYFHAKDDSLAEIILRYHRASKKVRAEIFQCVKRFSPN